MQKKKKKLTTLCDNQIKCMIKKRAKQLDMSVSTYLKFAAIKDIEENNK